MIRILHIVGTMNMGGQETFIMNLYRSINREEYQFDFIVHSEEQGYYEKEIKELGGKIYRIVPISNNIIKHMKQLYKIIKENKYKYVHRHTCSTIVFMDLLVAKLAGSKRNILHSHNSFGENKIINYICRPFANVFSDTKLACSNLAGGWLFGKKKKFIVIPNAINANKFKFNKNARDMIRREYNIDDKTLLIGNVGAFRKQKNQIWLIETFKKFIETNPNSKLMICGEGELRNQIEECISNNNLNEKIILTGNIEVSDYYSAFDVFVFPSIYEGLGIVLIEAQISSLPCIVSEAIQDEAIISEAVKKISLISDIWIKELNNIEIVQNRKNLDYFNYEKYDIVRLIRIMQNNIYNYEEKR